MTCIPSETPIEGGCCTIVRNGETLNGVYKQTGTRTINGVVEPVFTCEYKNETSKDKSSTNIWDEWYGKLLGLIIVLFILWAIYKFMFRAKPAPTV